MGSLLNSANIAAPNFQVNKKGLDEVRSKFTSDIGIYQAAAGSAFMQGNIMTQGAGGYWDICAGTDAKGISRANKIAFGTAVMVDVAVVMTGTTAQSLGRANVSNVAVRSAVAMGGTQYTVTTDYTVDATAGTVTRVAIGAITSGQTVYVTFTYALTAADFKYDGRTWWNNALDEVTPNANRVSIIQDWSLLFTVQYDTLRQYTLTGVGGNLYCSAAGQFSNNISGDYLGNCMQLPTASDPYMGVISNGNVVA